MKYRFYIFFWMFMTANTIAGQNLEAGVFLGGSNYQGD